MYVFTAEANLMDKMGQKDLKEFCYSSTSSFHYYSMDVNIMITNFHDFG